VIAIKGVTQTRVFEKRVPRRIFSLKRVVDRRLEKTVY
jgi:hypothetical protein